MENNKLEEQKRKLEKLNKQIKEEENKIALRLGRSIIKSSNLEFEDITKEKIDEISKLVANNLNNKNFSNKDSSDF